MTVILNFSTCSYRGYCLLLFSSFEGRGCVYSFDPVGSYEREAYRAGGSAGAILQPLLDNQVICLEQIHIDSTIFGSCYY